MVWSCVFWEADRGVEESSPATAVDVASWVVPFFDFRRSRVDGVGSHAEPRRGESEHARTRRAGSKI